MGAAQGRIWAAKKDFQRAVIDYNEAIGIAPRFAIAYYQRSLAYRALNNTEQADADMLKAKELGFSEEGTVNLPQKHSL